MLSYAKSAAARPGDRLNGLKKTVKLNCLTLVGFVKLAYLNNKVECSFNPLPVLFGPPQV